MRAPVLIILSPLGDFPQPDAGQLRLKGNPTRPSFCRPQETRRRGASTDLAGCSVESLELSSHRRRDPRSGTVQFLTPPRDLPPIFPSGDPRIRGGVTRVSLVLTGPKDSHPENGLQTNTNALIVFRYRRGPPMFPDCPGLPGQGTNTAPPGREVAGSPPRSGIPAVAGPPKEKQKPGSSPYLGQARAVHRFFILLYTCARSLPITASQTMTAPRFLSPARFPAAPGSLAVGATKPGGPKVPLGNGVPQPAPRSGPFPKGAHPRWRFAARRTRRQETQPRSDVKPRGPVGHGR